MQFAVDLVIVRGHKILFVVRKYPPGGFVEIDETAEQAAIRELLEETGVEHQDDHLHFVKLSSEPNRDPRGRVVSAAYKAKVPSRTRAIAGDDAREVVWLTPDKAIRRGLAFDHEDILNAALEDDYNG